MSKTTLDVFFDRGVLEAGDYLKLDRQVLIEETAITMDAIGAVVVGVGVGYISAPPSVFDWRAFRTDSAGVSLR